VSKDTPFLFAEMEDNGKEGSSLKEKGFFYWKINENIEKRIIVM